MENALGGEPESGISLTLSDAQGSSQLELLVSLSPLRSGGVVGICQDMTGKPAAKKPDGVGGDGEQTVSAPCAMACHAPASAAATCQPPRCLLPRALRTAYAACAACVCVSTRTRRVRVYV